MFSQSVERKTASGLTATRVLGTCSVLANNSAQVREDLFEALRLVETEL